MVEVRPGHGMASSDSCGCSLCWGRGEGGDYPFMGKGRGVGRLGMGRGEGGGDRKGRWLFCIGNYRVTLCGEATRR